MSRSVVTLRLLEHEAAVHVLRARIPFRYGNSCLEVAPVLTVRTLVEVGTRRVRGYASDCLPPRWFDKDPAKSFERDVEDQITGYRIAGEAWVAEGATPRSPFELWQAAYERTVASCRESKINDLTASFGSSFLERAVIDAACRADDMSFYEALRSGRLGLRPRALPDTPRATILCRHTVGLADHLTTSEIPTDERLQDGLPQSLEESIARYGLRWLKLKLTGDDTRDIERLSRIARVVASSRRSEIAVSLDGNEQYTELARLERLLEELRRRPEGAALFDAIRYIEQPLPRDRALDPACSGEIRALAKLRPVIIDESDDHPSSFERAVEIGYRGTSHKNCKGVFKSFITLDRIARLREERGGEWLLTAEDLANTPVLPLQMDLASIAALGIEHAERNGHHYFRGLDWIPPVERRSALTAHPDLYEEHDGSAFLRIRDGEIRCDSLQRPGFGYSGAIAFEKRTPLDAWSIDALDP